MYVRVSVTSKRRMKMKDIKVSTTYIAVDANTHVTTAANPLMTRISRER